MLSFILVSVLWFHGHEGMEWYQYQKGQFFTDESSSAEEFHPHPLREPDVTVSHKEHTELWGSARDFI